MNIFDTLSYFDEENITGIMADCNCTEDEAYYIATDIQADDWRYTRKAIVETINMNSVLITGSYGRWDGSHDIMDYVPDIDDALDKILSTADDFTVDLENGSLVFRTFNHDASSIFYVTMLDDKAADVWNEWEYDYEDTRSEESICKILFTHHQENIELNW